MENKLLRLPPMDGEKTIYRQLWQELAGRIRAGKLPDGTRLPAVRELADELGVASGTVKRAYDELEKAGLLTKAPGRGSFVSYQPPGTQERRTAAQQQTDALLQSLQGLGLSVPEMKRLLTERLRQFCARQPKVQAALIECNPEVLDQLRLQLQTLEGVELHTMLLSQAQQHPGQLAQQMDVMITTTEHAQELGEMTGQPEKVAKIALCLSAGSVAPIVKLGPGERVGVASQSLRFGDLMRRFCAAYTAGAHISEPALLDPPEKLRAYLRGKTAVLVPEGYQNLASPEALLALARFSSRGQIIPCAYQIDEGSAIYLTERLERLLEEYGTK